MNIFGECIPCECGYGTLNRTTCDPKTGQCHCVGESTGLQCDRCSTNNFIVTAKLPYTSNLTLKKPRKNSNSVHSKLVLQLDSNTLKCVSLKNRCPTTIEYGIQWQTTQRGFTAKQVTIINYHFL